VVADDIEAPFTIATGSTLFALLFLVLLLRASACACGGVSRKREREREREKWILFVSRYKKRHVPQKPVQSLGYQKKEDKEEEEEDEDDDFDKRSTLLRSK